ncbi:putative ferric-chelate reductase 1 [Salarias fasciatus]|uniref:putative ferric-chelate reductase 1 n=1 Tax=Salarias fasciatus TaxID=181472 RepID=UPI00117663C6|nr:putative ferric-chelate reductase 1 [Salarias fasciatus]
MQRGLIVLAAAVVALLAPGVRGTDHLSFDNSTQVNITRDGCGATKVCVEEPAACDPAGNSSCLFASVTASAPAAPNGTDLAVELSGRSAGYIAMGLTANASQGTALIFICARNNQNNGSFFFRTMLRNNTDSTLSAVETIVTGIRSSVDGDLIQCEFTVPGVNATSTRTTDATTFAILIGTGTTSGTEVGALMVNRTSSPVDVSNPSGASTTPTPATEMTTSGAGRAFAPHALLLLLMSVLKAV